MVFKEVPPIAAKWLAKKAFCCIAFRAYCPPGSRIVLIKECNSIVIVFCELAFEGSKCDILREGRSTYPCCSNKSLKGDYSKFEGGGWKILKKMILQHPTTLQQLNIYAR